MKIVVIGTGFGKRVVSTVWQRLGCDVEIVSPRDRNSIARACASGADLVSIHSPPFLHHEHVMLALDHGRNVLCDKPFGRDASEAAAMQARVKELGVLHFLNFEFRHHPIRATAKKLLQAGTIGTLRHINWTFIGSGLRLQKHRWLFDEQQAGGWIGAWGSHAIDTMRFLFDREISKCGGIRRTETATRSDSDGSEQISTAEDAFSGWFVLDGGGSVSIDSAFSTPVSLPHRINLLGSDGAIEIVDDLRLIVRRPGAENEIHTFPAPEGDPHEPGLVPWFAKIKQAVEQRHQIGPNFDDGLAVALVMQRLRDDMTHVKCVA